jgi:integrase
MRLYKRGDVWHLEVGIRGKFHRKSTRKSKKREAERWAASYVAQLEASHDPASADRLMFSDLKEILQDDYRARGNRSIKRLEYGLAHLGRFFRDLRAVDITPDQIRRYQRSRQDEEAANGTINREVSFLRRALRLAHQYGKLPRMPHVPMLPEAKPRDVTLANAGELAALLEALPEHHRGWVALAASTGWRKNALLSRKWTDIRTDTERQRWLCLDRRSSKNAEPYRFPLVGDVARILDAQRVYVDRVERRRARVVPWIFCYPDGRRIKHPENAFNIAAEAIDRPELTIHDLRRFAASRMAELGIPETDAMELLGMETRSIFSRYDISSGARKVQAVERMAGVLDAKPKQKIKRITS